MFQVRNSLMFYLSWKYRIYLHARTRTTDTAHATRDGYVIVISLYASQLLLLIKQNSTCCLRA